MISPKMFERFVLPELEASCNKMDFATYHMDGKGQIKHLDMLLGIEQLKGIQWVPGDGNPPAEEWLHVLGKIRKANKLVQVTVSSQGALAITKALGNRGFLFNIIELMHAEDANSFIAQLNSIQT
jgi:5-methyltetrahydrofolate--homocysteine methyltransferase